MSWKATMMTAAALALVMTAPAATAGAELGGDEAVRVVLSGEALVRYRHVEGKDFAPGGADDFVTQRVRLGLDLSVDQVFGVFAQIQDVRIWGSESDTLGDFSAEGLDLHQGYLYTRPVAGMEIRVGRQEINLLNQRLIGAVAWIEQARSFDAARVRFAPPESGLIIDAFYARTIHTLADEDGRPDDVIAATGTYRVAPEFVPSLVAIVDLNSNTDRKRVTAGVHLKGKATFGLSYEAEAYLQAGSANSDVSFMAHFAALRARYTAPVTMKPFVEAHFELSSGDDDPADADVKSFDTLFATNHKYYGEMDLFLNLPAHTGQRGLMDIGGVVGFTPHEGINVTVAPHLFRVAEDRGGPADLGMEVDTKVTWQINKWSRLAVLFAVFVPGDGLAPGGDAETFTYVTAAASL